MKPTGNGETDGALPSPLVSRVMRVMTEFQSVRPQAQGRAAVGGGGPRVGVLDVQRSSQVARGAVQKV